MARTLDDFVGTFTIRQGMGDFGVLQIDNLLCIGTGSYGDPVSDGIRIGVAIVNAATRERVLPAEGNPPAYAYLADGCLNGSTYWLQDQELPQPLVYQISLMTLIQPDGGLFKAPTLRIFIGDPQSAGVWGADDESGG